MKILSVNVELTNFYFSSKIAIELLDLARKVQAPVYVFMKGKRFELFAVNAADDVLSVMDKFCETKPREK
jgi:hypothetical protein